MEVCPRRGQPFLKKSARTLVGEPQNLQSGTVQDQPEPGGGCATDPVAHKRRPGHEVYVQDSGGKEVYLFEDEWRWFLEK